MLIPSPLCTGERGRAVRILLTICVDAPHPRPRQQPQAGLLPRADRGARAAHARTGLRVRRAASPARLAAAAAATPVGGAVSCGAAPAQAARPLGCTAAPALRPQDLLRHR